ncbi:hypothetical protein SALBM311S_08521 [Streptomyces alboniger]
MAAPGGNWATSIALSSLVAALTTVFSLILGATAATALARGRLPLHTAVYGLVLAPLLIPQVVIALGLFLFFEPAGMLGSPLAIALGHTVLAAPIAILIMISTLRGIDERLEDAAASMGASRLTIARRITFPLATPGLIAAAVFSFITSFDEFFIAQFMSNSRHPHPAGPGLQRAAVRRRPDGHRRQRRPHRPGHPRPRPGRPRPQTRRPPQQPRRPPRRTPHLTPPPKRLVWIDGPVGRAPGARPDGGLSSSQETKMKTIPYWTETAGPFPDRSGKPLSEDTDLVVVGARASPACPPPSTAHARAPASPSSRRARSVPGPPRATAAWPTWASRSV